MNLNERLDHWYRSTPRPSVASWDDLIDDLYRAQRALYDEYISLGSFDDRHPGQADLLFLTCGRWGWFQ